MSKSKNGLIAMVATAVLVNGVRTIIQPGEALPELPEHDEKELLESGAALDPEAEAATEKARKQEEQFAQQSFQEARERAMAERASIAMEAPADAAKDGAATEAPTSDTEASATAATADKPATKGGKTQAKE